MDLIYLQLIDDIGDLCHEYNVFFMTDAVQAFGHIDINVQNSNIALLSLSAHKFHGLKGTGALYVRSDVPLKPIITGGHQEGGLRAGTENLWGMLSYIPILLPKPF